MTRPNGSRKKDLGPSFSRAPSSIVTARHSTKKSRRKKVFYTIWSKIEHRLSEAYPDAAHSSSVLQGQKCKSFSPHSSIPVRSYLQRKASSHDSYQLSSYSCCLCGNHLKTPEHVLMQCHRASQIHIGLRQSFRTSALPYILKPSPHIQTEQQIWASDGSMIPASAGLLDKRSVTTSLTGPTTLVAQVSGISAFITHGELAGITAALILAKDSNNSIAVLHTDSLYCVRTIREGLAQSDPGAMANIRRYNGRSFYRWINDILHRKSTDIQHVKAHTEDTSLPSLLNSEADHYATSAQKLVHRIPSFPIPTFHMDEFTPYSSSHGWTESNLRVYTETVMLEKSLHELRNNVRMAKWLYEPRPPSEFPYTRAYSAYSAAIQLYARSGQLAVADTLFSRGKIDEPYCRFGCRALEDPHHLFVECKRYTEWRVETSKEIENRTQRKLTEKGFEETSQTSLLQTAKSLFINDKDIWPLQYSFYYLGHIPKLDSLLPYSPTMTPIAREQLLHHLAADWHTHIIRLAGRIFGDYQREMAKRLTSNHKPR
ncbi:hypothetical protein C8R41DRAFT_841747 [Lentinula lateritia]|uniref:RNase H type-1 domain-containing protein n=1 Tax=Lentinula lateritia TaxID=40482 RepID=A0ABQ8V933_9AGAR|nr:hypothetical protein C8R41DRAFT_841747 [Lentinula lateritia]